MPTMILNASMDQVVYQLCQWSGQDFIATYLPFAQVRSQGQSSSNKLLDWTRHKLSSLGDLEGIINSGGLDLFADDNSQSNLLIDYQDLELNAECLEMVKNYQEQSSDNTTGLILYSLNPDTSTNLLKLIKDTNIQVIDYKSIQKDKATKEAYMATLSNLADEYSKQLMLNLTPSQLKTVTNNSSTYREIIDHLDFLSLTDNPSQYISELVIEEKPMLFMLSFGPSMSQSTIDIWKNIPDADMQLSLSLAYTKLLKANQKDLIQQLVNTDYKVKTSSKLPPLTLWKHFLWKAVR